MQDSPNAEFVISFPGVRTKMNIVEKWLAVSDNEDNCKDPIEELVQMYVEIHFFHTFAYIYLCDRIN